MDTPDLSPKREATSAVWQFHQPDGPGLITLTRQVDEALGPEFRAYPEFEWSKYGVRPPEQVTVEDSWRSSDEQVFVFLLAKNRSAYGYHLFVAGVPSAVAEVEEKIRDIKELQKKQEKRHKSIRRAETRLERESAVGSLERLVRLLGLPGLLLQAIAAYYRYSGLPGYLPANLARIANGTIAVLFTISLLMLVMLGCVLLAYSAWSGYLIVRRMPEGYGD